MKEPATNPIRSKYMKSRPAKNIERKTEIEEELPRKKII